MRPFKKLFILPLLLIFMVGNAQSIIPSEMLLKINKAYLVKDGLSFNLTYNYYTDEKTKEIYKTINGQVKYTNTSYYSKLDNVETIKTPFYYLMVDLDDQRVMLDTTYQPSNFSKDYKAFDTTYMGYQSIKHITIAEEKGLELTYNEESSVAKIQLLYDAETYFIKKLAIHYAEVMDNQTGKKYHPKVEVIYSNYQKGLNQNDDFFSEKRYLDLKNGVWQLKPAFYNYEFINNLAN